MALSTVSTDPQCIERYWLGWYIYASRIACNIPCNQAAQFLEPPKACQAPGGHDRVPVLSGEDLEAGHEPPEQVVEVRAGDAAELVRAVVPSAGTLRGLTKGSREHPVIIQEI